MTVPSHIPFNQYTAIGGQTVFNYTFRINSAEEIDVVKLLNGQPTTSEVQLTLTVDYTVTGVGNNSGGTIVLNSPTSAGDRITIFLAPDFQRLTDFSPFNTLSTGQLNSELDNQVLFSQRTNFLPSSRIPNYRSSEVLSSPDLRIAKLGPKQIWRMNTTGTAIEAFNLDSEADVDVLKGELASHNPGEGASMIGLEGSGTVQDLVPEIASKVETTGPVTAGDVPVYGADGTQIKSSGTNISVLKDYTGLRSVEVTQDASSALQLTTKQQMDAGLATKQPLSAQLTSIAGVGDGIIVHTAVDTFTPRSLTQPAAGIIISNSNGVSGNPTFALANDLAAVEALASAGMVARTAADTWTTRTITGTANQITVSNGDGVAANPTISLPATINVTTGVQINSRNVSEVFIQSIDATGLTNVDFTDLPAGFSSFEIRADGIRPGTDAVDLRFRTSPNTGGSPTFDTGASDYGHASHLVNESAATSADGSSSAAFISIVSGWGNGANQIGCLNLVVCNPLASQYCQVRWQSTSTNTTNVMRDNRGSGRRKSAAAVNAIRFYFSSGTFASGTFRLYGKI